MKKIELCLIRRKNRLNKKFRVFDVVVVRKNGIHRAVIEKLGVWDLTHKKIIINMFRLVFWIGFNVSVSYDCFKLLSEFYFFDKLGYSEIYK